MKILIIGGTGFIGPFTIRRLQQAGHDVTVFHRGGTTPPAGVAQIIGDRNRLSDFRDAISREKFDVVVDFVLSSERQAKQLMATLRGITARVLAWPIERVVIAHGALPTAGGTAFVRRAFASLLRRDRGAGQPSDNQQLVPSGSWWRAADVE